VAAGLAPPLTGKARAKADDDEHNAQDRGRLGREHGLVGPSVVLLRVEQTTGSTPEPLEGIEDWWPLQDGVGAGGQSVIGGWGTGCSGPAAPGVDAAVVGGEAVVDGPQDCLEAAGDVDLAVDGAVVVAAVFILGLGIIAALNQVGIATTVTTPVLIAVLATIAGILVVGVGGGLIKPMQTRWESYLTSAEEEAPKIREHAKNAPSVKDQAKDAKNKAQAKVNQSGQSGQSDTTVFDQTGASTPGQRRQQR